MELKTDSACVNIGGLGNEQFVQVEATFVVQRKQKDKLKIAIFRVFSTPLFMLRLTQWYRDVFFKYLVRFL